MKVFMQIALLIFCIGVTQGKKDPCTRGPPGPPGPPRPPRPPTRCRVLGGFCYDDRCKNCTDGQILEGLCGNNEHKKCCLPGNEPDYFCCEIYSDPHITTFDGFHYDVQVTGNFTVSNPCNSDDFKVVASFEYPNAGTTSWTQTEEVIIEFDSHTIVMTIGGVNFNGAGVTLPYTYDGDIYVYFDDPNLYVRIYSINLLVCFNMYTRRLTVYVDERFYGKLCGLCGNLNKDAADDDVSVPPMLPPSQCPNPRDHSDWGECRTALGRAMTDCEGNFMERYLASCAFDMCAGGMEDAGFTIDAANEFCITNIEEQFSKEIPAE